MSIAIYVILYHIISYHFVLSYYDILYLNIHGLRRVKSLNPIVSHVVPVAQAAKNTWLPWRRLQRPGRAVDIV